MEKYRRNIEVERSYADVPAATHYDLMGLAAFFGAAAFVLVRMMA